MSKKLTGTALLTVGAFGVAAMAPFWQEKFDITDAPELPPQSALGSLLTSTSDIVAVRWDTVADIPIELPPFPRPTPTST